MRIRYLAVALPPLAAASAFAVLPAAAGTVAAGTVAAPHVSTAPAGRMHPAVSSPLAYKYAGTATRPGASFGCQQPGAAVNCYQPAELARAYDIPRNLTGAGQTIVIVDAFGNPTIEQDLNSFDTVFGLPAAKLNVIYPDGQPAFDTGNADMVNWSGEVSLDVESAHAVAPAATIDLVVAKSDQDPDILSAEKYAVHHHLGNVLSQSYGENEACEDPAIAAADHVLYKQAARQGMSVFASSGDDGADQPTCDGSALVKAVSLPAADTAVTAVGATSLTATHPDGGYVSETAWNDQFGSSGGGFSTLLRAPGYQRSLTHTTARGVPDVSYSGDVNNGLLISWSQGDPTQVGEFWLFGGTSAGSPQWAAIAALADQASHHPLGFLNPRLYAIAHTRLYSYAFHDITTGDNTVTVPGYPAAPGWDPVTGLGSPDAAHLITLLAH